MGYLILIGLLLALGLVAYYAPAWFKSAVDSTKHAAQAEIKNVTSSSNTTPSA